MNSIYRLSTFGIASVLACVAMADPAQTTPAAAPATPSQTAPAPAAPAAPPAPPAITWTGNFDVYYGYNFNRPAGDVTGPGQRNFDYKDDLISLGLAELNIARAVTDTSRFGFTFNLVYGPTADLLVSGQPGNGDTDNKNILQAYGTYLIPVGKKDLTVDLGKFVTHMGNEVIQPSGNWNYSRSILFQDFIPYYHAGVRAAYPLTDTVTGNLYVYNGWNNVSFNYPDNNNKAFGAEIAYAPNPNNTITFNGLTANLPQGVETDSTPITTLEGIWSHTFNPTLSGAIDANYDFGKQSAMTAPTDSGPGTLSESSWTAYGIAAYLKYALKSGSYFAGRAEYIRDPDGSRLGIGDANAKEVTLTYSLQNPLFKGAELRLEYRYDVASQPGLFVGSPSATHQNTLTISHIFTF